MKQDEIKIVKKHKHNPNQYYFVIGSFTIVLVGVLIFSYLQLQNAATKVSDQLALLNQYALEEAKISNLLKDYKEVEEQSILISEAIPNKENLVSFIENIEKIGSILELDLAVRMKEGIVDEMGVVVDVESESTKRVTTYAGISSVEVLEVGITVRTNPSEFNKIINFIGMLEDLKYYSKIVDMKFISGTDERDGVSYLDSIFTLNLYVKAGGLPK